MKRPIRLAATVSDAAGIQSVWTGRLENCYASIPDPNATPSREIPYVIRSVPGERLLLGPDQLRDAVGDRLLGMAFCEHHNIPAFANKLMVVGSTGLALFDPEQNYAMVAGTQHAFLDASDNAQAADVQISSNGHSWLITQPDTGQAWIYEPVPGAGASLFDARLTRIAGTAYLDQQDADEAFAADETTFQPVGAVPEDVGTFGTSIVHGSRYIVNLRGSGRFIWSGIAGGHTQHIWLPQDFATAESAGDPLVSVVSNQKLFYLLGTQTTEVWYTNTGDQRLGFYSHASGSDSDRGCVGPFAQTSIGGDAYWLGHDGSIFVAGDRQVRRITSPAQAELISNVIRQGSGLPERRVLENARLFSWSQSGHDFLAVRTEVGETLVISVELGLWHIRRGDLEEGDPDLQPWRIKEVVSESRSELVFGRTDDAIYQLDPNYHSLDQADGSQKRLQRRITSPLIENNRDRFRISDFVLLADADDDRRSPQEVALEFSVDRGENWSNPLVRDIVPGGQSEFGQSFNTHDLVVRVVFDQPTSFAVSGLYADWGSKPKRDGRGG